METAIYNYKVEQSGDASIITYQKTPLSYKAAMPLLYMALAPAIVLTFVFTTSGELPSIVFAFFTILFALAFGTVFIINLFRKTGEIRISDKEIAVNGKGYDRNHAKSVLIKTPSGEEITSTVIVAHRNPLSFGNNAGQLQQGMKQLSNESKNAFKKQLRKVGYKIDMRFGSKNVNLAKSLSETHAEVLFDKIVEIGNFQIK